LYLYRDLSTGSSIDKALKHSFEEAHRFILNLAEAEKGVSDRIFLSYPGSGITPPSLDYGTTAVVCVLDLETNLCYIANVGDSRCVIFSLTNSLSSSSSSVSTSSFTSPGSGIRESSDQIYEKKVHFETIDHNPTVDEKERNRITLAGGTYINTGPEVRVYPSNLSLEAAREQNLTINMSRALGHLTLSQHGILATPDISCIDLSKFSDLYLLCASDGLWSVMNRKEVMSTIEGATDLKQACLDLMRESDRRWQSKDMGDNITVTIVKLLPQKELNHIPVNNPPTSNSNGSLSSTCMNVSTVFDQHLTDVPTEKF